MQHFYTGQRARFGRLAIVSMTALALGACGSSEDTSGSNGTGPAADTEYDVQLIGSIGDGPIVGASIRVMAKDGTVLTTAVSSQTAGYDIQIKTKGKYYPLTIDAQGGTDLTTNSVPDFTLTSASLAPRNKDVVNVNPFTTLAIATARRMNGGLSSNNISSALSNVVGEFNSGLTSAVSLDPMTTPIDDSNLAEIVKASEMLAEIFRRTQAALGQPGTSVDQVIDAIASDLVDGKLDGAGAGANKRISALAIVASAEVMLEGIVNQLDVGGQNVTSSLDAIIAQLASGQNPPLTGSRPVTTQMITVARRGIDAAIDVNDSTSLQALSTALDSVAAGMTATAAAQQLPIDPSIALDPTLTVLASASVTELDTVLTGQSAPPPPPPPSSNTAPVISGTPSATATENMAYSFVPTASDADGDTLTFTISGQPGWANFSPATGAITGTPGSTDVATYSGITITVSDGIASAQLGPFSIDVVAAAPPPPPPPNTAPVISGTPSATATENMAYSFVPTASDADGDSLTFTISGQPGWANFSPATGAITGTPGTSDIGTYTGITITVTDGIASAQLGPFSIDVQAVVLGSATLTWLPPTQNSDGTPLTDLAGYKVLWGTQSGAYTYSATIMNPGITTYLVDQLVPATYYFAVTALNSSGVESTFSNEASKMVN